MATIAKINCLSCNKKFDLYFEIREANKIQCPYCYTRMEEQSAEKTLEAIGLYSDTNRDLRKYVSERGEPLFQFDLCQVGE